MTVNGYFILYPTLITSASTNEPSFQGLMVVNHLGRRVSYQSQIPLISMDLTALTARTLGLTLNLQTIDKRGVEQTISEEIKFVTFQSATTKCVKVINPEIIPTELTHSLFIDSEPHPLSALRYQLNKQDQLEYTLSRRNIRYIIPRESWNFLKEFRQAQHTAATKIARTLDVSHFEPCNLDLLLYRASPSIDVEDCNKICLLLTLLAVTAFIYRFAFYRVPQ